MDIAFRIGARGSPLSLTQTRMMQARLAQALGVDPQEADRVVPIVAITTSGDKIQDRRLLEAGGKGLFTKELDEALREQRIDLAVHSLKDVPTVLPDDIVLAAIPERVDPRDAFLSEIAADIDALPAGAVVGTASLRRQAQLLFHRSDLSVVMLRGNVDTRMRKVAEGAVQATFLALSGLSRLGLAHHARSLLDPYAMPPAAGQGALAITARRGDSAALELCAKVHSFQAGFEVQVERRFLAGLDGTCHTPIGAHARLGDDGLSFVGEALTADGVHRWRREGVIAMGPDLAGRAEAMAAAFAQEIRAEAGPLLPLDA
jgi:hydroxymethylbilane synthase